MSRRSIEPPTVSVIVCTRDRPEELDRCLCGVMRQSHPEFEVLVIDNAPRNNRTFEVAERWGVRYAVEPAPGLSRARNLGARLSRCEIVAYIDDDAVPEPSWLSELAKEFADPDVMAVTGPTLPLSLETETQRRLALIAESDPRLRERRVVNSRTPEWFELASFGGLGDGGNMAFRRQAFPIWRGFDERLGRGAELSGGEDHEALFALVRAGYAVVSTPKAIVRHPLPDSLESLTTRYLQELAEATGYFTRLLVECRGFRLRTIRYGIEALCGKRREWRGYPPSTFPRLRPRWRSLLACLRGPLLYARARRSPVPVRTDIPATCPQVQEPVSHLPPDAAA